MGKHTDQLTRLDSTSPLPPEPTLNPFPAFDVPSFSPLLCSVSQITCVVSLAKLLTGFPMSYSFGVLHCKGAFLACFFTEKFIWKQLHAGVLELERAGWDEMMRIRVYKITTELPFHKPLSTCQNRSEKYQYFCNASKSSSGIFEDGFSCNF